MKSNVSLQELDARLSRLEKIVEAIAEKHNIDCDDYKLEDSAVASYDLSDDNLYRDYDVSVFNAEKLECSDGLCLKSVYVERTIGFFCDPMLINENLNMPIDDVRYIHVKLKSNVDASKRCLLRAYFTTEKHNDWSQSKSVECEYPAGRTFDVYIETKNRFWNGNITKLRIDPVEGLKGSVELELVELVDANDNALYSFDFTKIKSIEDTEWKLRNTSKAICAGKLFFDINVIEKKKIYTDPYVRFEELNLDITNAKYFHIKMRTDIEGLSDGEEIYMQLLFKTQTSDFWSQDRSMRFSYKTGQEIDAYVEIKQLFWKGTLTAFRIDPFENYEGTTTIKLVEFLTRLPCDDDIDILEAKTRKLEDRFNKIYK